MKLGRLLIPAKQVRAFVYSDTVFINPGLSTASTYIFSGNGIFDPDITGVGHQPLGFDQYVGVLYDHYCCIHAKIVADFTSGGNAVNNISTVSVSVRDIASNEVNTDKIIEQGRTVYGILTNIQGIGHKRLVYGFSPPKFLGVSHALSEKDIWGTSANNPPEQCFFHLSAEASNEGDAELISVRVRITYTCVLLEPRWLNQS